MKEKYKILIVLRWPVGGIRSFLRYVYSTFDPLKYAFTIILPFAPEIECLKSDLSNLDVEFIVANGIPNNKTSGSIRLTLFILIQVFKKRYNLVHSHGFTSGMCAAIPAFIRGVPHLTTSHETLNERQFAGFKGKLKRIIMSGLFKFIDKIHLVSHDALNNLLEFFPSLELMDDKYVIIRNGIDVNRFITAKPRDFRAELGLEEDVFLVGFMGRFMAPKGFRYLIESVDILSKKNKYAKRFIILTFGDGGFILEEKLEIKKKGLDDFFCFMPFTPNIAEAIKGVDVIAIPSLWEACPLLPMEAMICGTPVIGSDCIGLREVLKDTPASVIPKADSNSLANSLSQEMNNNRKAEFILFKEIATERFDVSKTRNLIMAEYEKLFKD